jgi:cytochrome c oxidase subunit 2
MRGEGVEALSSPKLADLDDWYIVNQLKLYAAGLRGTHPSDTYGQQMAPIIAMLEDEQGIRDLAAYIATLD